MKLNSKNNNHDILRDIACYLKYLDDCILYSNLA